MSKLLRLFVPGVALVALVLAFAGSPSGPPKAIAAGPIVVNEIESNGGSPGDWVELLNTGLVPVDISGYKFLDNDNTHTKYSIPAGTILAPGAYYLLEESQFGFGLGTPDSAQLFFPDGTTIADSFSWTPHSPTTLARCPNGTGNFVDSGASTKGAANNCLAPVPPVAQTAWPGGATITPVDPPGVLGGNMSGLTQEGTGVLWAVKNGPGTLYRLIPSGGQWIPDPAFAAAGKVLRYSNGAGDPDAEGVTFAEGGSAGGLYVSTERNNAVSGTSRNAIQLFMPGSASPISATREWNLTADLPTTGANLGIETIAWIPDSFLTSRGFIDESKGTVYNPASYPNHGTGLFFVGVEANGILYGYALNHTNSTFTRIATVPTGFTGVMGSEFDRELNILWAVCDDTCNGRHAVLNVVSGRFQVTNVFDRPTGMPNINNEGFAVGTQGQCVNGVKPVFWADDSNTPVGGNAGNAIRTGTVQCIAFGAPVTTPVATPTPAATAVSGNNPVLPAPALFPYVFQNPGALAAITGPNRPATPRPAVAVAPQSAVAPSAVAPIAITPPRTGDAGMKQNGSFWSNAWN